MSSFRYIRAPSSQDIVCTLSSCPVGWFCGQKMKGVPLKPRFPGAAATPEGLAPTHIYSQLYPQSTQYPEDKNHKVCCLAVILQRRFVTFLETPKKGHFLAFFGRRDLRVLVLSWSPSGTPGKDQFFQKFT
jgi:hypothetical protein